MAWVNWEKICKMKEKGGLGVTNLRNLNMILLVKWKLRLDSEEKGLWKELLFQNMGHGNN